jgi:hypothetical protein
MSASSHTCGSQAASASCAHSIPCVRSAPLSSRRASAARSAGEKSQPGAREGESGRTSARSMAQPIVSAPATMYLRAHRSAAGQWRDSSRLVHVLPRRERAVHVPDGEVEQPGEDREESGRGVPYAEAHRELSRLVPRRGHCRTYRSAEAARVSTSDAYAPRTKPGETALSKMPRKKRRAIVPPYERRPAVAIASTPHAKTKAASVRASGSRRSRSAIGITPTRYPQ